MWSAMRGEGSDGGRLARREKLLRNAVVGKGGAYTLDIDADLPSARKGIERQAVRMREIETHARFGLPLIQKWLPLGPISKTQAVRRLPRVAAEEDSKNRPCSDKLPLPFGKMKTGSAVTLPRAKSFAELRQLDFIGHERCPPKMYIAGCEDQLRGRGRPCKVRRSRDRCGRKAGKMHNFRGLAADSIWSHQWIHVLPPFGTRTAASVDSKLAAAGLLPVTTAWTAEMGDARFPTVPIKSGTA